MIFEEWELNLMVDSLESNDNLLTGNIVTKLKILQSESKNKRYTFRTTDWELTHPFPSVAVTV